MPGKKRKIGELITGAKNGFKKIKKMHQSAKKKEHETNVHHRFKNPNELEKAADLYIQISEENPDATKAQLEVLLRASNERRYTESSKSVAGYFGVFKESSGSFRATIWINGKTKNLGSSYDTAKQAAMAVDREAIKFRKPFSSLNYPKKAPVGYTPKQQALQSNNTVGYRGVSKNRKKFIAFIVIVGNTNTLVHTTQQKKQPLHTIVLFSKPTNQQLY